MSQAQESEKSVVDMASFLERIGGSRTIAVEILQLFLVTVPSKLTQIESAIASENWDVVGALTHELKGASGNVSAVSFYETILTMREHLRAKELNLLSTDFAKLSKEFERVREYVETRGR